MKTKMRCERILGDCSEGRLPLLSFFAFVQGASSLGDFFFSY